jgi:nitronate monooxygenase
MTSSFLDQRLVIVPPIFLQQNQVGGRVLCNDFTTTWHGRDDEVLARREELCQQVSAAEEVGDPRLAPVYAGTAVGLIAAIEPAGQIVHRIVADAERILRERAGQVVR